MPWESIGSVSTGDLPNDDQWIRFCLALTRRYVEFVAGPAPSGHRLGIMENEHELGVYPSLGVYWESDLDAGYVGVCERALEAFDEAVEWSSIKDHWESSIDDADEQDDDDDDEEHGVD